MLHHAKSMFDPLGRFPLETDLSADAPIESFSGFLLEKRLVSLNNLQRAEALAKLSGAALPGVLVAEGILSSSDMARAIAAYHALGFVDLATTPPDPRLLAMMPAAQCLEWSVVPWRQMGGMTWIATPDPAIFATHAENLREVFGAVASVCCDLPALQAAVATSRCAELRDRSESRLPEHLSAKSWPEMMRKMRLFVLIPVLLGLGVAFPTAMLLGLIVWMVAALCATTFLRGYALFNTQLPKPRRGQSMGPLPTISILVPMFNEPDIAPRLLRRLGKLEYPRPLLDLVLVLEDCDTATRQALAQTKLPPWMRVIVVPEGQLRTKPRAMNYALDFCKGQIIGIYDAEDAPEPGQLQEVAAHFATGGPDLACVQGALDYYNPRTNWLARCFTVEYAAWFRVVMPALQRLRLPMPLGGTTLFVRRDVLEKLGAWDAHNVTEDADLGVRLARAGWRTEMLASTTEEEANCRLKPWLKQRSRWIKGHLLTWIVHMRNPAALWRDLGARGFWGYQVVFLGAQSQVLLAPLMWSFWLAFAGLPHPVAQILPQPVMVALFTLFLLAEGLTMCVAMVGARRTRHYALARWAPSLHFYHPLGAIAGWRAVWESFTMPFYWAKTSHGHFDTVRIAVPGPARPAAPQGPQPVAPSPAAARVVLFRRAELAGIPGKSTNKRTNQAQSPMLGGPALPPQPILRAPFARPSAPPETVLG